MTSSMHAFASMRKALQVGIVVTIVTLVAATFTPVTFLNREKYRAEARGLYDRLQPGMAKSEVLEALRSGDYQNLEFRGDDPMVWYVSTPYEFGAQNWQLLIEFRAERVSAVRVRTADTHKYPPSEAPPDKP
jgi:hypothetical protein